VFNEYSFRMSKTLIRATTENVERAKCWLRAAYARGSSDFNTALLWGLGVLKKFLVDDLNSDTSAAPMLILFSDGYASVGVTNPSEIYYSFLLKNRDVRAVVHTVSIGWEADQNLLGALSSKTGGVNYVITNEKTFREDVIEGFWGSVGYTALRNLSMVYSGASFDHMSIASFQGLQAGGEVVVTGKLNNDSIVQGHIVVAEVTASDSVRRFSLSRIVASPSASVVGMQKFMDVVDAVVWITQLKAASASVGNCTLVAGCVENKNGDILFYDSLMRSDALEAALERRLVIRDLTTAQILERPSNVPLNPILVPYTNSSSPLMEEVLNNATRLDISFQYDPSIGYSYANSGGAAHTFSQLLIAIALGVSFLR